tara:strand:- start:6377 stop:7804 length:1428 start_codon:yes stop_codon:yes gene_type:complete
MIASFVIPPSKNKRKFIRLIDCSHETKADYLWQPNDYIIMSSYFKDDDQLSLIDGTVDELNDLEFYNQINNLNKKINLIFFSLGSVSYYEDVEYLKKIRDIYKQATICVLGDIFLEENFRKDIFDLDIDAIIYKPYNLDIEKIATIRQLKKGNSVYDFDFVITDYKEHPFLKDRKKKVTFVKSNLPRHELFKKNYAWPFLTTKNFTTVTTMWGCTYSCSYCTSGLMHPICKDNEDIIEELKYIKKLGFKEVQFFDKVFGVPKNLRKELLKKIISEDLNLKYSCYFHPSMFDEEILSLMKNAGFHTIVIGIDSKDLKNLALYNRKVNENVLHDLLDYADKIGISVCADFIIGLPHENKEDIYNTINYAKEIKIDFASFNIAAPLPGSTFRENAIKSGTIKSENLSDTLKTSISISKLSLKELNSIREKANIAFYLRWKIFYRRMKNLKSLEHFLIQIGQFNGMIAKNFFGNFFKKN